MLVKVSFSLITPVIITDPLHLDALLMAVHPDAKNIVEVNRQIRDNTLKNLSLPLKKVCLEDSWIWASSTIDLENAKPFTGMYKKAKTRETSFYLTKSLMINGGMYKDNIVRIEGYTASNASFLAVTDDVSGLSDLCTKITHLGKLRGFGYGTVRSFSINKFDGDWHEILVKNNIALRNIPEFFCQNPVHSLINPLPPYWDIAHREKGAAPGEPVILKEDLQLC